MVAWIFSSDFAYYLTGYKVTRSTLPLHPSAKPRLGIARSNACGFPAFRSTQHPCSVFPNAPPFVRSFRWSRQSYHNNRANGAPSMPALVAEHPKFDVMEAGHASGVKEMGSPASTTTRPKMRTLCASKSLKAKWQLYEMI